MQESNKYQHINENTIVEFKNAVIANKDNILQFLPSMIPDLKITLPFKNNKVAFTANVNSIFDIYWYTINRFIDTNSDSLDLDFSIDTENLRFTYIVVCISSCRWMEMKNNIQLYCDREDCEIDRNRRKQKDFQLKQHQQQ